MLQNVIDEKDDDDDMDKDVHNLYVNGKYNNVIVFSIIMYVIMSLILIYLDTVSDIEGAKNKPIDLTITTDDEAKDNTESSIHTTVDTPTGM